MWSAATHILFFAIEEETMAQRKDESDAIFHQRCGDPGLTAGGVIREYPTTEEERPVSASEARRRMILDGDLDPKQLR